MRLVLECSRPSIERCSGHSEIAGNLRGGVAAFNQADSASNLTVSKSAGSAAKVLSSFAPFADGIGNAFALDLVFHLRESGHDREQHRPHRCGRVDVAAAQVQNSEPCAAFSELVCERKHVLGGASESIEGCDHESVARDQRGECPVELRS